MSEIDRLWTEYQAADKAGRDALLKQAAEEHGKCFTDTMREEFEFAMNMCLLSPRYDTLEEASDHGRLPKRRRAMISEVAAFVRESNLIEGIEREPTKDEIMQTFSFVGLAALTMENVLTLQAVYAPGKPLRDRVGMNVRVGDYVAPGGGRNIEIELMAIIGKLNKAKPGLHDDPWKMHCAFETLHPFMDGNGRTGRALWAWHMLRLGLNPFSLPFLHRWYYQTLEHVGSLEWKSRRHK